METAVLHDRALDTATAIIGRVTASDLVRPTPCAGWDLGALLAHCVGQNHGFADAVLLADAPTAAYAPRAIGSDVLGPWTESVERVRAAFGTADPDSSVLLAEFGPDARFPVDVVRRFHLLDTVVHTWDVATALGIAFRPDDACAEATAALARRVPAGEARTRPGAAFGPTVTAPGDDPWTVTLALLGRQPPGSQRSD